MSRRPDRDRLPPAKDRVPVVLARLAVAYPEAVTALNFGTPFQLLVATILSAQCTDVRVNLVTPALFAAYPTAEAVAAATPEALVPFIRSAGFFRTKAKSIHAAATRILTEYGGAVPRTLAELVTLPGVGRKTANVVLGDAFGTPGVTVDTHVGRLSRRLGFTRHVDPVKVELTLNRIVPQPEWTRFSHRLILHGRAVCRARRPLCERCVLADVCPRVGVMKLSSLSSRRSSGPQVVKSKAEDVE